MFVSAYERLATYLGEHYPRLDHQAVAHDLLDRAVLPRLFRALPRLFRALPRLFRALLGVGEVIKGVVGDPPGEETLARDVDLQPIRRLVDAQLNGGR
jgi:hypothetical protein